MTEYRDWSVTASANTGAAINGFFPEGMNYSDVNNAAREFQAILARDRKDRNGTLIASGSTSSYVLSPSANIALYRDGDSFVFQANVKNVGATTLQVSSLSARPVVKTDLSALQDGDIVAGGTYHVFYKSASGNFQIANPSGVPSLGGNNTFSGNNTFAGAVSIGADSLSEYIADTVGAMVTGNTETSMSVTYDDADNTLDFAVNAATTGQQGTTRYATGAEVITGSLTVAAVTPDSLTSDQSLLSDVALSGTTSRGIAFYHVLPGGMCIQGGPTAIITAGSSLAITFGRALSDIYSVTVTPITTSVALAEHVGSVDGAGSAGFDLYNGDASDRRFYWLAVGQI